MNEMFIKGITQFKNSAIEKLQEEMHKINAVALSPTVSLCHKCFYHIPAWKYQKDGKLFFVKHCAVHGTSHHMIESDYEFYDQLRYTQNTPQYNFNASLLVEGSDRCNLECPHCYHLPDNNIEDIPRDKLIGKIKDSPIGVGEIERIVLSGAETTLRPDFCELIEEISNLGLKPIVMTNGIRFGDSEFAKRSVASGLVGANIGLNHPEYNNYEVVRKKQIKAIDTMHQENVSVGYISYTMINLSELDYILNEIVNSSWNPNTFRIRAGSEVGRNSTISRIYLSDIYKATKQWCIENNKNFRIAGNADDNIYHIMVFVDNKEIRLIQWCDITDIDMEELRSGPWCNFVSDGITNFLHQIIRRDVWKNQKLILPDSPPERYQYSRIISDEPLDLLRLHQ